MAHLSLLVVAATGELGKVIVKEALERGHAVSVLVRDEAKLKAQQGLFLFLFFSFC